MNPPPRTRTALLAALLLLPACGAHAQVAFYGPTPYLQRSDTPLGFASAPTRLEDMEDGSFAPGIAIDASIVPPGDFTDSVDSDDGLIDGLGRNGRSAYSGSPITIVFVPPTIAAGVVWTDGGTGTSVSLEAFGPQGEPLGTHGPFPLGDDSNLGTTAEDRFLGVRFHGGIGAIRISHTSGGYEIDHVQWLPEQVFSDGFE